MKKIILFIILSFVFIPNVYALDGWQEKDNKKFYYENNIMVTGFKEIDDKLYFFSRVNGALKTGWQSATEGVWYQNQNGEVVKDWQTIDGKKYYFNEQGIMQKGFVKLNDIIYFFSRVNGALKTGWQSATEGVWYQNQNGEVVKDWQTIEGKKYYFNEQGIMQKGFLKLNDKLYFFSRVNGALKTGWQSATEGVWYQNKNGEVVKDWQTIDGKKYYFNGQGIMQKGFLKLNDKIYFFSRVNGALKTGWQSATEGVWYQNKNGEVVKDWQTIDGKKYYFNEQGIMQKGFVKLNDKIYFFSRVNGALKTGWQGAAEGYWYQNSAGELVTSLQTIDGRNYKFNEQTGLLEGFKIENGKKYYYNPDGTQAKGVQYMTNMFWKFNEITGAFEKFVREVRVIDVSAHQEEVDWNKVKASGKVDAVILRLGYGIGFIDSYFLRNKAELERLGIPYSVYLFSYAENKDEALRESNFVVDTIKNNSVKIAANIFSIYYDLEDWEIKSTGENSYGISKNTYKDMINTFIDNTEKKLCIKTRVYASKNYIEERFPKEVQNYATWVAQWSNKLTYAGPYEGWQYTNCASVPGISGCVDMSKFYY